MYFVLGQIKALASARCSEKNPKKNQKNRASDHTYFSRLRAKSLIEGED